MIERLLYISQQNDRDTHLVNISRALDAGCKWIELRVKGQPVEFVLALALEVKTLCNMTGARLIINDYPEIALQAGAAGVHLGYRDMTVADARKLAGDRLLIGGTSHDFEEIVQRDRDGADYIALGPFSFTTTKDHIGPVLGLEGYKQIMDKVHAAGITTPVIAVGGILEGDITDIMKTGVYGIAVSGAVTYAADPAGTVRNMLHSLDKSGS